MVRLAAATAAACSWCLCQPALRCVLALALIAGAGIGARSNAADAAAGINSRAARSEAVSSIPFKSLDRDAQSKVSSVINRTSIFRRLPAQVVDCDPRYFIFLVRHPEVVVNIWRKMKATNMLLQRKGPESFYATDNAGTVSNVEFLYGDHSTHILYCEGSYSGPMTARAIQARCVLVLHTDFVPHKNGRHYVSNHMDVFLSVQNVGVDLVVRAFQNMIGRTTDQNFVETANFVTKLGRTTETNGPGIQRLATQLTELDAGVRKEFYNMAGTVYEKARKRKQQSPNGTAQVTRTQKR